MPKVREVELVDASVEHVDELVDKHAGDQSVELYCVLANYNLS